MNRKVVSSSLLASVGYDAMTQTLELEFQSGSVYRYAMVPESVYLELMGAASHGVYFNAYIKDFYSYRRV